MAVITYVRLVNTLLNSKYEQVLQAMAKEMQSVQHKYADALGSGSCDLDTGKLEGDIKMLSLRTSELEGTVAGILAKGIRPRASAMV